MVDKYPGFFWRTVEPYIGDALRYLELTIDGKQWTANLYSHVFTIEHERRRLGPQPIGPDSAQSQFETKSAVGQLIRSQPKCPQLLPALAPQADLSCQRRLGREVPPADVATCLRYGSASTALVISSSRVTFEVIALQRDVE